MLDPRVIRQNKISARPITKKSHDARMSSSQHPHDSPFDPLPRLRESFSADFDLHAVAVHCIFRRMARNKNVPVNVWNRLIRNHKSVSILVQHEPPADSTSA